MANPAPGSRDRADAPAATASAAEASTHASGAPAECGTWPPVPEPRDAPSSARPTSETRTPPRSDDRSRTPRIREESSARSPIPPADVAWTSEMGANARAQTYSPHPARPARYPATQRGLENNDRSERRGRRGESVGMEPAAPCCAKNPQFSAAVERTASASPAERRALIPPEAAPAPQGRSIGGGRCEEGGSPRPPAPRIPPGGDHATARRRRTAAATAGGTGR